MTMTDFRYRLVNGELVPLTPEEIAEFEEAERNPPPERLANISRRQFFQAAAGKGMITQAEALDAMHGTLPDRMQEGINTLPPDQKFAAEMMLIGANEFERHHPLVE